MQRKFEILLEMEDDPFDSLLGLEDQYYKDGYDLGVKDGSQAGLIEGRLFGLEKGFEKYATMGNFHGRAIVWTTRLPSVRGQEEDKVVQPESHHDGRPSASIEEKTLDGQQTTEDRPKISAEILRDLPANDRLEKHVRTFYALVEPSSISTENNEESVSDFDDRLKRAEGKMKIIEKLIGEAGAMPKSGNVLSAAASSTGGQGHSVEASIEDVTSLQARH